MKLPLLLASLVALTNAAPMRNNLQQDLLDFVQIMPMADFRIVMTKHLKNDPQFQSLVRFFQSDEWQNMCRSIRETDEVIELKQYLNEAGLNVDLVMAFAREFLMDVKVKKSNAHPSARKFLKDMGAVIPRDKIMALLKEKMETSVHFRDFYDKISSDKFHELVERAYNLDEVKKARAKLLEMDIPVERFEAMAADYLGWNHKTIHSKEANIR